MRQLFSSIPGQVLDFIVVLIAMVLIFQNKITTLVNNIWKSIGKSAKKIY
ncbi:Flp1 family type IVb pilin [Clostridium sp. L2-50]|nr:Flp1 family type IVb pilin [Clostridium sp. L2-50]EDO58002.1 hypothetical protein CLOL250_01140 [Clostridium sp. L2-50]UEA73916.1 hypothetical protein LK416_09610 [Lachnospiraceae bacterium GAM79]UEA77093.1 hypothetical protein LK424_12945 [Lachnospiraceae bacterium GAM79]